MPELKYHYIGVPIDKLLPEEDYIKGIKVYASGYLENPYGIEWMEVDLDCPLPELVKIVSYVAFGMDDIQAANAGKEVIIESNSSTEGVTLAFIENSGVPVELLQFDQPEVEIWLHYEKFSRT